MAPPELASYQTRQFQVPSAGKSESGLERVPVFTQKRNHQPTREESVMNTKSKIVLAAVVGAALGGTAIQGLHAQAQAKLKAYSVGEIELIGALPADYLPTVRKAIEAAHGHALRTLNGRVVYVEGAPAPKNVAIIEWDSVDDAVAFYKSKAWTDMAPQREKAQKTIRRYVVEVEK
jgi:uncharacterized protein (DUF1330 family)